MRIGEHWALATSSGAGAASITAAETAAYLRGSALASSTLRKIWRLSDTRPPRGQLTKDEVIDKKKCVHYISKKEGLSQEECLRTSEEWRWTVFWRCILVQTGSIFMFGLGGVWMEIKKQNKQDFCENSCVFNHGMLLLHCILVHGIGPT